MSAVFVTATGTDIGKTFVTAALARTCRMQGRTVEALKPVISGFDLATLSSSDTGLLLAAIGRDPTPENVDAMSPWRFAAPLSPDMAGKREGRSVDFDALVTFSRDCVAARRDVLLIEGVGGIMAPIDQTRTVLDWVAALDVPILLVAGSYLGAISHTLTALDVLRRRDLSVLATVISETAGSTVDLMETAATVERFVPATEIVVLPRLANLSNGHPALSRLAARL